MRSEHRNVNPISEIGFFFHAALHLIKKVYLSSTEGFNRFFTVDADLRVRFYRERGVEYTRRGRYDIGVSMLEQVLLEWPADEDTLFHLGFCYLKMDRIGDGIELLERSVALGGGVSGWVPFWAWLICRPGSMPRQWKFLNGH
ncbi:MAG: tetratricopeptide repeat protein [Magnetococcales bacterium]|nr:tetratricopeptide repeat protein [Magnetococcales bacterium]